MKTPPFEDDDPLDIAAEGAAPQPGHWPEVANPTPPEAMVAQAGNGYPMRQSFIARGIARPNPGLPDEGGGADEGVCMGHAYLPCQRSPAATKAHATTFGTPGSVGPAPYGANRRSARPRAACAFRPPGPATKSRPGGGADKGTDTGRRRLTRG